MRRWRIAMILIQIVLTLLIAATILIIPALLIRFLARIPFYWIFNPANTFALIVTEEDKSGDGQSGGGNVVNALHAVPGKVLKKDDPDNMKWKFISIEDDPDHDEDPDHGFLFRTLGVQSMGNIFYTTRVNVDKRARFAREEKVGGEGAETRATTKEELHAVTKVVKTRNVFYTGELTVVIKEADTADKLGLDFEIDFIFARRFPVRSVLRIADSAAFLTSLVEKIVNNTTVSKNAEEYIGGKNVDRNRRRLIKIIESDKEFSKKLLDEIGIEITAVSLRDVSMTETQRKLLQLQVEAEKQGQARVIAAEKDRDAQVVRNTGDADRVTKVILPIAHAGEEAVRVREAEAYENNKVVTTYAPTRDGQGVKKMVTL